MPESNPTTSLLLRGLTNDKIDADGSISACAFYFLKENSPERDDDFIELSINWYDNEEAKTNLFNQKKDNGEIQFKKGAAVLIIEELVRISNAPRIKGNFSMERKVDEINCNKYHGNLLLRNNVHTKTMKKFAAAIALSVEEIFPNPNLSS